MLKKPLIWVLCICTIALLVGTASAGFLKLLDVVTQIRVNNAWLVFSLPLIGFIIGFIYLKFNPSLGNGNVLIISDFMNESDEKKSIPFSLAPMIFVSTILTHLGGGSAGREGTAVQIGASISSQFKRWITIDKSGQRLLTCIGVSAGFAGVFGTPIAASIFALELFSFKKTKWFFILPSLLSAYLAHWVCLSWGIHHATYTLVPFNDYSIQSFGWLALVGILFGLTAMLYIISLDIFSSIFKKIQYQPLRTCIGGVILTAILIITHQEKMAGLGLNNIADAFIHTQGHWDFLIKLLLTSITLSAGFKGGEVTPLFFIGAVLGSVLIAFIPLPISLLAGLGLISVFAGATHCLISSIVLGIELFGIQYSGYIIVVCMVAYLFSGIKNIYTERPKGWLKQKIAAYFL